MLLQGALQRCLAAEACCLVRLALCAVSVERCSLNPRSLCTAAGAAPGAGHRRRGHAGGRRSLGRGRQCLCGGRARRWPGPPAPAVGRPAAGAPCSACKALGCEWLGKRNVSGRARRRAGRYSSRAERIACSAGRVGAVGCCVRCSSEQCGSGGRCAGQGACAYVRGEC